MADKGKKGQAQSQKLKLMYLMRMLEEETDLQHGLTMPQIIERLEAMGISAERKSVYRDIAVLRESGIDIKMLPTRPVEYALVRSELGINDVMMLVDIVQSSRFITERKSNQLVKSLKGLVSERERKLLDKRVHVRGRIKNQSESIFHSVDVIHEALQQKRKVQFLYFSYGTNLKRSARHEGKRYELTPVKVVFSYGNYYLAAYDDADALIKTYRIDRMELLQMSDAVATRCAAIANYDCDDFAYRSFGMYHGDPVTVTLCVSAPLMDTIVDRFGRDIDVLSATEDYADVLVSVRKSPQFFGWVAGLNGGVTIKAPKRLSEEYKSWLTSLIEEE